MYTRYIQHSCQHFVFRCFLFKCLGVTVLVFDVFFLLFNMMFHVSCVCVFFFQGYLFSLLSFVDAFFFNAFFVEVVLFFCTTAKTPMVPELLCFVYQVLFFSLSCVLFDVKCLIFHFLWQCVVLRSYSKDADDTEWYHGGLDRDLRWTQGGRLGSRPG